jgi:hypothetical protein
MPMRIVTVRRWEIVLAFVLLTLTFVFAIALVNHESQQRSHANRDLIADIQQSRAEVSYTTCLDQNGRHDQTVKRLDVLLSRAIRARPSAKDQIRATRASTIFLIEALAPHQNCKQIVLDRYGFVPDLQGDK